MDGIITVDVEDWFNILDTEAAPRIEEWGSLPFHFQEPLEKIFELLDRSQLKATFFWLGWFAERFPFLVRRCRQLGHEVASHGYGHVLAYKVGRRAFREDVVAGKDVLEQIAQAPVHGFRAAGFSTTEDSPWVFDEIAAAGHSYDSSVFPASRAHGGIAKGCLEPHVISTRNGPLVEFPQSMVELAGKRITVFGGGYLRLAPLGLVKYMARRLSRTGRPLIVYVHPREVDPDHPRLPLSAARRFKSYVGLRSTYRKLEWFCANIQSRTMSDVAADFSTHADSREAA